MIDVHQGVDVGRPGADPFDVLARAHAAEPAAADVHVEVHGPLAGGDLGDAHPALPIGDVALDLRDLVLEQPGLDHGFLEVRQRTLHVGRLLAHFGVGGGQLLLRHLGVRGDGDEDQDGDQRRRHLLHGNLRL